MLKQNKCQCIFGYQFPCKLNKYYLFKIVAYPAGSGVRGMLLCDGEFSGNSICGKSSVQGLESHLGKIYEKRYETRLKRSD